MSSNWEQLIAVRERNVSECLDVAVPLWRQHWQPLLLLNLITYIPSAALAYGSSFFIGSENWHQIVWIYLILIITLPVQTASLCIFLGRAQFKQVCTLGTAYQEWLRRWSVWFCAVQAPYFVFFTVPLLLLLIGVEAPLFAGISWLTLLLASFAMSLINNEVVLLEGQNYKSSRKRIRTLSRSRHAHKFKWFMALVLIGTGLIICGSHALNFFISIFSLGHGRIDGPLSYLNPQQHIAPWIMWPLFSSFFACCSFLAYTNLRTCSEGWALEHRLRAAANQLESKR